MDPTQLLEDLLTTAKSAQDLAEDGIMSHDIDLAFAASEMATAILTLNEWIEKGGFMPSQWRHVIR